MPWSIKELSDHAVLDELESQTDRGATLIAGAYLEDRLIDAIKARTNRHADIENRFYKGHGPLASFSAKIDLGYLLGIYDETFCRFLHVIRRIRNEFAHQFQPLNFDSQKIRDLCANIAVSAEIELTEKGGRHQKITFKIRRGKTPKEQFINAIQLAIFVLDMEIKFLPLRKPAPPVYPQGLLHEPPTSPEKS